MLSRATGAARIARLVILISPILATLCTTLAAGRPFLIGSAVVVALAVTCAVVPDTHLGLVVIIVIAVEWIIRVQDPMSGWSIGLAALIGMFHTALAVAGVAPAGAELPRSISFAWNRRALLSIGPPVVVWAGVVALDQVNIGRQAGLIAAAFIGLAVAGHWMGSPTRLGTDDR